jgi:quercetin dioxygenase-like cupin family protein
MKRTRIFAIASVATVCGAGAAFAAHVTEVDPATVPTGTLVAHNQVDGIRISSLARAVDDGRADVFIAHARFTPGQDTGWHTHPGPVFVQVVRGSLAYQDARHDCKPRTYQAGQGFFDRGHGHVHRAVAGPTGAEFYPVFVMPPGSAAHIIPATAPKECTSAGDRGDDEDESDHEDESDDHADDDRDEAKDD